MIVTGREFVPVLETYLGTDADPQTEVIVDHDPDTGVRAVFGFSDWIDGDMQAALWARPGGLSRRVLAFVARYVFDTAACARLTIKVRSDNARMLSLAPRLGFVHEGTMRAAHQGLDVHIFGMLRSECRWLSRERADREETEGATATTGPC